MMLNACYIRDNLSNIESTFTTDSGEKVTVGKWTLNAICGMLGNISVESMVNPGSWQNGENSDEGGFGLTHWSPPYDKQKYIFWARKNYENADATLWNMDWQLEYIRYEVYRDIIGKNGYQWHSTLYGAGMSFEEFIQSELSVEKLAEVFVRAYEKPLALIEGIKTGDSARVENCIKGRQLFAKMWKDFFDKKSLYADNRLW